ncbi:hypothetical protein TcasGA2_TC033694 [Tribolium castaneum]|uniref:Uncharacterized protein n=1 Tax=Tribolium castaneum TaxID=7070 RepID=A0A139WEL2_TRICA|nr:hypothetical protein TcasGA2_TC033694 [Tribolium castaneum]
MEEQDRSSANTGDRTLTASHFQNFCVSLFTLSQTVL